MTGCTSVSLILLGLICVHYVAGQTVITNTTLGPVMGIKLPIPGVPIPVVTRYAGIPYAEPPIGQLRFAKPVPKTPWDGVLNATLFGAKCPQTAVSFDVFISSEFDQFIPNTGTNEDCLFLNMYVPHGFVDALRPLPVMVYLHGGSLVSGEGALYDGSLIALQGQVIVVNMNYRLGLFGFLSTGDDSAPGNYGLWDQRLAIQWVKDNIANFGGDPDQITIFGESAGGWSVTYQMISPLNDRNVFQRVISQSGVAFPGLIIPGNFAQLQAWNLASSLGCNLTYGSSTTRHLISCLRGLTTEELLSKSSFVTTAATIDGEFLTTDINSLLSHPRVGQYDLLLGVNSQEGSVFQSADNYTAEGLRRATQSQIAVTCQCENPEQITNAILAFYFSGDKLGNIQENLLKYLDVIGDLYFDIPGANFRNKHAMLSTDNTRTYYYYFDYEVGKEFLLRPDLVDRVSGAPHILDVFYVFGLINLLIPGNIEAQSLSDAIIKYWSQFAKNGDPNGAALPEWPEFEAENETYIILDANIRTGQRLKADKVAFWNEYIPTITDPFDEKTCSYEVPVRSGTVQKPDTKTVQIESKDGEVLGSITGAVRVADEAMGGREVAKFLGIPYAKPPLGNLRFKPPEDTGPWADQPLGIPEKLPPACPQDVTLDPWMVRLGLNQTSEDCLTLNIYAPTQNTDALPVLVFIHVGYGVYSTSSVYDATLLASQAEAVFVVINHRLGALGFLSTEDEVAPGNYGLHDILAALKWVNKYIGSFGGDPEQVTIQGHGSGAVLAHFLVLSERAKGLFNKAVLMSATAISPPVDNPTLPRPSEIAKALALKLGCPTANSEMMITCLRGKPVADFVSNTVTPPFGLAFPTVVDGDLITDKPLALLKAGRINNVNVIVGLAKDEDAIPSFFLTGLNCPSVEEVQQYIRIVSRLSFENPGNAALALIAEYIGKGGLGDDCETRGSFRQFMNDYLSYWSTLEAARLHANAGHSVYFYSFDLKPPAPYKGPLPPQAGPALTDDLQFLLEAT
ncbi:liver carboxylesterase-like [Acanthaster planci]|uniref:Liver carboxylesterase-like n=1 Tax=Acanthaster planci TaxID=133434 RepID=A0A8B7XFX8_ACAPL|nr:liver carboxylesterase-like [Acanthaster planci]